MIKDKFILAMLCLLFSASAFAQSGSKYTVNGQIKDGGTGEDLISATIYIPTLGIGSTTNEYGFYSMTLQEGNYDLIVSYLGFEDQTISIELSQDITKNIELVEMASQLGEVYITADREKEEENINSTEMSVVEVNIETVKKLPALFGEVDIIKAIQLLPGVKTVGEGSSGFYVRGGNVDQNLVLLDEAPIYNASHVLGFFSSFNPDAIKDMKLYKGAMPAHFGGRLSSVLDIRMKEGNSKRFSASGGIGTLMSRLALEAPLGENGSFMVAGRRSYIDVVGKAVQAIRGKGNENSDEFFFYDLNAKANYRFDDNNRLFLSGYFGRDVLGFEDVDNDARFRVEWGNTTATARWNHLFSPKLFSNLTYYYSNYNYFLDFEEEVSRFKWASNLREHSVKLDFGSYVNPSNTVRFGVHAIHHSLSPGAIESFESGDIVEEFNIQKNKSLETAFYLSNEQIINDQIKVDYGIRVSVLNNLGPQKVFQLDDVYNISDTINHLSGIYNTYWNLEPRLSLRYKLNSSSSIKASYNRTAQYIQLASNGNSSTPFDIWFSSSQQVRPQLADQIALGYFKNIANNSIELSAEIYHKKFINSIDFKDHANLLLNDNLEAELRIGEARSYGFELMAKKNKGRLTGWISYTYSKAEKRIATVNNENWYNAKYDKPHDLSIVASYELNERISLGSSFVYSTGSAVTFPTGKYHFNGVAVPVYSERNAARLPDYHRLDFSLTLKSKKNKSRRLQTETVFSIYNAYNRKNAFSINFKQDEARPDVTIAEKRSIFSIVPAATFNVKF